MQLGARDCSASGRCFERTQPIDRLSFATQGGGEFKARTAAMEMVAVVSHPDHNVEDAEVGYQLRKLGSLMQLIKFFPQPAVLAKASIKPEPCISRPSERALHDVVPHGYQLRSFPCHHLPSSYPSDISFIVEQPPRLIGRVSCACRHPSRQEQRWQGSLGAEH